MRSLGEACFEGRDKNIGIRRETMEMGELALLGQLRLSVARTVHLGCRPEV